MGNWPEISPGSLLCDSPSSSPPLRSARSGQVVPRLCPGRGDSCLQIRVSHQTLKGPADPRWKPTADLRGSRGTLVTEVQNIPTGGSCPLAGCGVMPAQIETYRSMFSKSTLDSQPCGCRWPGGWASQFTWSRLKTATPLSGLGLLSHRGR